MKPYLPKKIPDHFYSKNTKNVLEQIQNQNQKQKQNTGILNGIGNFVKGVGNNLYQGVNDIKNGVGGVIQGYGDLKQGVNNLGSWDLTNSVGKIGQGLVQIPTSLYQTGKGAVKLTAGLIPISLALGLGSKALQYYLKRKKISKEKKIKMDEKKKMNSLQQFVRSSHKGINNIENKDHNIQLDPKQKMLIVQQTGPKGPRQLILLNNK